MDSIQDASATRPLRRRLGPLGDLKFGSSLVEVGTQVGAFVLSLGLLIAMLAALDYAPGKILYALWDGSAGSTLSLGISLSEATPVILTAVAVWLAVQGGVFNIGADGQLQIGGLAAFVTVSLAGLPNSGFVQIPAGLIAAAIVGALWSGIAAAMKTYRGANEIISTLMLNFVAFIVVDEIMRGPLQSEENPFTPQTDQIPNSAHISPLVAGTQLTWSIIVAVVFAIATLIFVTTTTKGLRLRAIGLNREAARHAGIPIERYWLHSMLVSGALCGLAGGLVVLGLRYYIAFGWAEAWGFQGILVAFLALRSPYLIPVWGVLFGMLAAAGPALKGDASVPDSIVNIMSTLPIIVLFLLYAAGRWLRGRTLRSLFSLAQPATAAAEKPGGQQVAGE